MFENFCFHPSVDVYDNICFDILQAFSFSAALKDLSFSAALKDLIYLSFWLSVLVLH